ncbi:MAG: hypothetical protein MR503_03290 [Oscillospiraceae bacterium]|nr:hypothetical protein [Oscillospiraceae bacterium]
MLKRHKKLIIAFVIIVILILIYHIFKYVTIPSGEKEHLELDGVLTININVDKWYSGKTVTINNKDAVEELQDYLNSLEIIEIEKDYERNCPGHLYMMFLLYDTISIKGEYLSIHPNGEDDKVFTEYYIVDSGYNPLTGGSKVSRFMDKLIRKYGEKIS